MISNTNTARAPHFILITVFLFSGLMNFIFDFTQNQNLMSFISFFLVSTIGIYHGAFDIQKATKISNYLNLKLFNFNLFYIMFALSIITLWILFPQVILFIFLLISIHHFGSEEYLFYNYKSNFLESSFRGLLVIMLPLVFHYNETIFIFKTIHLINQSNALSLLNSNYSIMFLLIFINLFFSFISIIKISDRIKINFDMFIIVMMNYIFDPLFAFSLYFCFLHSIRNIYKIKSQKFLYSIMSDRNLLITTIITFFIFSGSFIYFYFYLKVPSSSNYVIFVGLAALTFPHIGTEMIYNRLNIRDKIL